MTADEKTIFASEAAGSFSANWTVCPVSGNDRVNEPRKLDSLRYDCRIIMFA
jgi:hypothetical protein